MHLTRNLLAPRILFRASAALALAHGLFGCAHTYQVKVEALKSTVWAPRQTYRLVSVAEGREEMDPHYADVAAVVERALAAHGLHAASRPEWADVVIKLDYGTSTLRLKAMPDTIGDSAAVGIFYPDKDGGPVTESTGVYVPTAALTRVVAVREKRLLVFARENTLGGNTGADAGAELWRVEVGIEDGTSSFEQLLPILAGAMVDYIDATSAPVCIERVSKTAPDVLLVSQEF